METKKQNQVSKNHAFIYLGMGHNAIVDIDQVKMLNAHRWLPYKRKRTWYAYTLIKGREKTFKLFMHRLIAMTPANMVVHHINGYGLDNRRSNLQNMTRFEHKIHHIRNPRIVKYLPMPELA